MRQNQSFWCPPGSKGNCNQKFWTFRLCCVVLHHDGPAVLILSPQRPLEWSLLILPKFLGALIPCHCGIQLKLVISCFKCDLNGDVVVIFVVAVVDSSLQRVASPLSGH